MTGPSAESDVVLIVAPRGRDGEVAGRALSEVSIRSRASRDLKTILKQVPESAGALLIASEALHGDDVDALGTRLKSQPAWSDLPILLLGDRLAPDRRAVRIQKVLQECSNLTLLERPLHKGVLVSSVRTALRARRRQYEIRDFNATLEIAVRERTAALEEVVKTLRSFTYTVAHDLRAPIRTIHRYSEILLEDGGADRAEAREHLRQIVRAAHGMDDLIQALLSYSSLNRTETSARPVALSSLIPLVLEQMKDELRGRKAVVRIEGWLPVVRGDERLITQILTNLLSNASKFVAPGTLPEISIRAESGAERVRLWVEDNGIGIDPAFHEKAFEVFQRLVDAEQYPGTGIGLAIVRRAAELMGGTVGLVSSEGAGSRFWLELPAEGAA